VDFHAHTRFSPDGVTPPAELVRRAAAAGLDRIAVTDHGEIEGALRARELDPARVIVGEEIRCADGTELIGLYLRQRIPPGLEVQEVVERIRDQGGLVYVPHPFAYATRARRRAARSLALADMVEVFNSRAFLPVWNRRALAAAAARGIPACAGSDAHFPWEIGRAHTRLAPFRDAAGLRSVLRTSIPVGVARASPLLLVASTSLQAVRWATGRRPPDRTHEEVPVT
jgi:predicted metal-dependent phosphoesterase TrpH